MPAERRSDLHLEIAHVLFIDIVGYSQLLVDEQSELLQQLNGIVRGTEEFRKSEINGELIRLPTGDGMALVFLSKPEAPVECALQIGATLKGYPDPRLRMGIHSGPVNQVSDVNERSNVAGAGINMAQRVMDCGDAGHILLSKRAADDLAQYRHWQPCLHDLGECEVKHGVKVGVVNLYTDEIGNPELPEKFTRAKVEPVPRAPVAAARPPARRAVALVAGSLVLLLAIGAGFWLVSRRDSAVRPAETTSAYPRSTGVSDKSIAVLPFENLSEDKNEPAAELSRKRGLRRRERSPSTTTWRKRTPRLVWSCRLAT